ncbi:MAG: hypothetical protein P1Q69_06595 [Candidatus Thorarchaeota archaeon]|nr:hypothetical protein [Candidatus Thorarchaeota archaeon]
MKRSSATRIMEKIGLSLNGRDVQILGIILNLQMDTRIGHTVEEIHAEANTTIEKRFSKAWIYKCLSNLENDGFIIVNRIDTPNTYSADPESIGHALQTYIDRTKIKLADEIEETEQQIEYLENIVSDDISRYIIQELAGNDVERLTGLIEGLQNVRSIIVRGMCTGVGEGDILRINAKSNVLDLGGTSSHVEQRILEAARDGLEVRALLNQAPFGIRLTETILRSFAEGEKELMETGLASGKVQIRLADKEETGYTMVSLNRDKMVLFLAYSPRPDSVALITRKGNHILIDDAVNSFDALWDRAQDLSKTYSKMFRNFVDGSKN